MDFKKFLMGGIIGGIVNFLLGWLIYGILLMETMHKHATHSPGVFREEEKMIWWSLVLGNFALGFMITYVLMKGNIKSFGGGATTGFVVGLLTCLGLDTIMYAQMKVIGLTFIGIDVAVAAVITGIVGGIVGWFLGRGEKAS